MTTKENAYMQELGSEPYWTVSSIVFFGVVEALAEIVLDLLKRVVRAMIEPFLDLVKSHGAFYEFIVVWILAF